MLRNSGRPKPNVRLKCDLSRNRPWQSAFSIRCWLRGLAIGSLLLFGLLDCSALSRAYVRCVCFRLLICRRSRCVHLWLSIFFGTIFTSFYHHLSTDWPPATRTTGKWNLSAASQWQYRLCVCVCACCMCSISPFVWKETTTCEIKFLRETRPLCKQNISQLLNSRRFPYISASHIWTLRMSFCSKHEHIINRNQSKIVRVCVCVAN